MLYNNYMITLDLQAEATKLMQITITIRVLTAVLMIPMFSTYTIPLFIDGVATAYMNTWQIHFNLPFTCSMVDPTEVLCYNSI